MRNSNGASQNNKGDVMTTLLDSTDSDVEWLSLPPIKGKKPIKRKKASPKAKSVCDFWSMMKIFLLLTVVGAVFLLSIMTVYLSSQINKLQEKVQSMESRKSLNAEDIQKLFEQLEHANKTIVKQNKQLTTAIKDLTSVNATVQKLSETVDKLSEGIKAAPELKLVPERLNTVAKSLADLGSDVAGMKDTVKMMDPFVQETTARLNNLTLQISDMKQSLSDTVKSGADTDLSPELANIVQSLPQQVQLVNNTVSAQLSVVMKSLSTFEDKFQELRNITDTLTKNMSTILSDHSSISADHSTISADHSSMTGDQQTAAGIVDVNSDQFKASVTDILQSMLGSLRSNATGAPDSGATSISPDTGSLQDQLNQLQGTVQNMSAYEGLLHNMNTSVNNLNQDVSHLTTMIVMQTNQVTNLTHHVTAIQNYVTRLEQNIKATLHDVKAAVGLREDKEGQDPGAADSDVPDGDLEADNELTDTKANLDKSTTTEGNPTELKPSGTSTELPTTTPEPVKIDLIHDAAELQTFFDKWNKHGTGKVEYKDLPGFLGPYTPDEEKLKFYDEDNDGAYTLQEFAHALGYKLDVTTPAAATTTTGPDI